MFLSRNYFLYVVYFWLLKYENIFLKWVFFKFCLKCKYDIVKFLLIVILFGYILYVDGCLSMWIYCNLILELLIVIICL